MPRAFCTIRPRSRNLAENRIHAGYLNADTFQTSKESSVLRRVQENPISFVATG